MTPSAGKAAGSAGGTRDHGGGLDAAVLRYGGSRSDWIDLSTGINPHPYPLPPLPADCWTALPDGAATERLTAAARSYWQVPDGADIVAAPGASALIARIPLLAPADRVAIPGPTYNEHAAAFRFHGWAVTTNSSDTVSARVVVHPNNPDGRLWPEPPAEAAALEIVDESFCDVDPAQSRIAGAARPGTIVLKSFGKFWGLAGVRLGFAIGAPRTVGALRDHLGPWPVAGPALAIGAAALEDTGWAEAMRHRLSDEAHDMDDVMRTAGAGIVGGTSLFRLYDVPDAPAWQDRLARAQIWTRIFPYSSRWLRLGLPAEGGLDRLRQALR